jgi:GH25 family lysozyme M1 (1,4-beta-N-acetylmuramidase)
VTAIDTSAWNGHPDFAQVKASGVSLVIPKAVDLERGYPVVDSVYYANRAAIRAAGLRCGSYLFNGPDSPMAGADYYFSVIDWKPGEVTAIDVENALGVNRWNTAQVLEFCTAMIGHGVPASLVWVYMSSSVEHAYDWSPIVALGCKVWPAQYNANDGTVGTPPTLVHWPSYAIWQHTSVAVVPGISGHVDMNIIGTAFADTGTPSAITPNPVKRVGKTMLHVRIEEPTSPQHGNCYAIAEGGKATHITDWATYVSTTAAINGNVPEQDRLVAPPADPGKVTGISVHRFNQIVIIYAA